MIVVAIADFDLYHEAVSELRGRGVTLTAVEPGDSLPERACILLTDSDDGLDGTGSDGNVTRVTATGDDVRRTVDEVLTSLCGDGGQAVVGVDPGTRPGIAVLSGGTVVAVFHVLPTGAIEVIREETDNAVGPVACISDGVRSQGAKLISEPDDVTVELVDETGATPYLGSGARDIGGVLAVVNIARRDGERIESCEIEPTEGELTRTEARSRETSEDNHTIDEDLARRVTGGELSIDEAPDKYRLREE